MLKTTLTRAIVLGFALFGIVWLGSLPTPSCKPPKPSGEYEEKDKTIKKDCPSVSGVNSEFSLHKISITITNYGRTPAFLYCQSAEMMLGPLPAVPIYPNAVDLEPGTIIERGELRTLTARGRDNRAHFDVRPFVAGQTVLWVYGIIWFRDFLNEHHVMRFCADLHVPQGPPQDTHQNSSKGGQQLIQKAIEIRAPACRSATLNMGAAVCQVLHNHPI